MKNNRVSTIEGFIKEINKMPQPVGVILFGADSEFKKDVYRQCAEQICGFAIDKYTPVGVAEQTFSKKKSVLKEVGGNLSYVYKIRNHVATALRDSGAKSIVGIYAKIDKTPYCKNIADWNALHWQIEKLLQHPPADDKFDRLIILDEKRRDNYA